MDHGGRHNTRFEPPALQEGCMHAAQQPVLDKAHAHPTKQWWVAQQQANEGSHANVASPERHFVGTKQADLEVAVRHDPQPVAVCKWIMARREG